MDQWTKNGLTMNNGNCAQLWEGERGSGGERERERGKEEGEKKRGSFLVFFHFYKGTVMQVFWSEFFALNSSFGSH
jgi:hypothetical protein